MGFISELNLKFCIISLFFPLLAFIIISVGGRLLGRVGASLVGGGLLGSSLVSLMMVVGDGGVGILCLIGGFEWVGGWVSWGFIFDIVGLEMIGLILAITLCVFIYSIEYMNHDPHFIRFLCYLCLFSFFMILLVTSSNLLQLFIGWEGVGLVSFLLINFWWMRLEANRSALKAMVFNRIGDSFYLVSLVVMIFVYGTTELSSVMFLNSFQVVGEGWWFKFELTGSWVIFGIVLAMVGKSAQLGLHAWLPDAMEGPTPVSSLLHSATMVTAGVFLLIRFADYLIYIPSNILNCIALLGGLTALVNSIWGVFQWDLKKIIAFSTCSQLGLMVATISVIDAQLGLYHLLNHGFFKSLLFLSAGSIIHGLCDEQDVRKMGGLVDFLPVTACCMLVGGLALCGFPFLSGFYSKEKILFSFFSTQFSLDLVFYVILLWTSFFTVLYTLKMLLFVFWLSGLRSDGFENFYRQCLEESNVFVLVVMCLLSVIVICFGFFSEEVLVGVGCLEFGFIGSEVVYPSYKLFLVFVLLYMVVDGFSFLTNVLIRFNQSQVITVLLWIFSNRVGFGSLYRRIGLFVLRFGYLVVYLVFDRGVWERVGSVGFVRMGMWFFLTHAFGLRRILFQYYLFEFFMLMIVVGISYFWGFGYMLLVLFGFLMLP